MFGYRDAGRVSKSWPCSEQNSSSVPDNAHFIELIPSSENFLVLSNDNLNK